MARRPFRRAPLWSATLLATLLLGLTPLAAHASQLIAIVAQRPATSMHAGTTAVTQPGAVWIWGAVGGFKSAEPMQLPGVSHVVAAAASFDGLIVLKDNGTVWSLAPHGQGVSAARVPGLNHITSIAAGASHYLALRSDGTVFAWGDNSYGQLGDGLTASSGLPVQVDYVSHFVAIATRGNHNIAVARDGSVWVWGSNANNDLGISVDYVCSGMPCIPIPTQFPGIHNAMAVAAGDNLSLAATRDGTAWQWGSIGLPIVGKETHLRQVPSLSHVTALAGGNTHDLALESDGTVRAWGSGQDGELGNAGYEDSVNPVQMHDLTHVKAIAAGDSISAALTADGSVWAWGTDVRQYVDMQGTNDTMAVPVRVRGLTGIGAIAAGETGLVAIGAITPTAPITLSGTGASAVDPLLTGPWASGAAAAASAGISVTYTSTLTTTGEAAALTPWLAGKADFTATDLPLTGSQERAAVQRCGGSVMTVPVAVGGVALTYHLPGVGARLALPPDVLAPLLLGQIHDWNDVRLQRANPGLALPQLPIRLVYRADAAADTDTLTRYLTSISPDWKARVGAGMQVAWPTGQSMRGSLGVLAQVLRTPGALGYVALQDALAQHAPLAALRDHAGQDVTPSLASVARAASSLAYSLPRDLQQRLIDAPGAGAYPLGHYSFLDFCGAGQSAGQDAKGMALRELARYIVTTGQAALPARHLAPLPIAVQRAVLNALPAAQR